MPRISIADAKKNNSGRAYLAGFVRNLRLHKGLAFIDLADISGTIQVVVVEAEQPDLFKIVEKINLESVIEVSGDLKERPLKKDAPESEPDFELLLDGLKVVSLAEENLPIPVLVKSSNEAHVDKRFDYRWLDLRAENRSLIFKTWTSLEAGFREYFLNNNFIQIYTPSLMNTASETGADVFTVNYFDRKAYLSQSPQFFKQMAMAAGLEKVFIVGSVFRAEKSFTSRHTTEFTGWDLEVSYISYQDLMKIEENLLVSGLQKVKQDLSLDIEIPSQPFPVFTFKEAKERLKKINIIGEKEYDFSTEEEKALGEIVKKEFKHDFLFITDYPVEARPFYHRRLEENNTLTRSFDLLYKGLEISTGSEREHRYEILRQQALEKDMNLEELEDYLNFFRYGCPNHGGIGIGPARIIFKLLNLSSVKEANFLPRDVNRLNP